MSTERLILFPGMACDGRLFAAQRACGLRFEAPELPMPQPDDDLASYAARVASELALDDGPCVLGGISFGGMLACELAARCNCRRVLLVASCRSGTAIPARSRALFRLAKPVPDALIGRLAGPACWILAQVESARREHYELIRDMCLGAPVPALRSQAAMILGWKNPSRLKCPVLHIHGRRDHLIPIRGVHADEVIPDGGHFINLTHPAEVTRFVARQLA